jgi:tRNA threonylcarbamoyladenosine biosynthesis protein TsaB
VLILVLRTDKPEAEIGLFDGENEVAYEKWLAHRALAETLHQKLDDILKTHGKKLEDIGGLVVYQGPGSFTGLRIGMSVANASAYSLQIPIVAARGGDDWIKQGIERLMSGDQDAVALPDYGGEVFTTKPRK